MNSAERLTQALAALRKLAIIPTMAPGHRAVVHDGYRCRVCASQWALKSTEYHQEWCALRGSEK